MAGLKSLTASVNRIANGPGLVWALGDARQKDGQLLFLLNDTLLKIDGARMASPLDARRFESVSLGYVVQLGRELFSEEPLLHQTQPERARRLAWLLNSKQPELNAALFISPSRGCKLDEVTVRFCALPVETIAQLHTKNEAGLLDAATADREVWRRLAA